MLSKLKGGDELAAAMIWERFFDRILRLSKHKLGNLPKRTLDEEDIALSALNALYVGAAEGRFRQLENRDDLWQVLCMITSRKAALAWRKDKSKKEVGESIFQAGTQGDQLGIAHIASSKPDEAYVDSL